MSIRIICIGKKHELWVDQGIMRYQKRLRQPFKIEWVIIEHSGLKGARARQEESQRIIATAIQNQSSRLRPNSHKQPYLIHRIYRYGSIGMTVSDLFGSSVYKTGFVLRGLYIRALTLMIM